MLLNQILNGGGRFDLTGQERLAYLWRCDKITCKCKSKTDYEIGISGNLVILYEVVKKVIESSKAADKQKYLSLLEQIQAKIAPFTIKILNLKSLQCVILMTLLLIETEKIPDDKLMASYTERFKIKDLFKQLTAGNLFLDLDKLEAECLKDYTLKNIIQKFRQPTLDEMINKVKISGVEYCDDIIDVRLSVLLGELSLEEIIESELNIVHLIGITTEMEWADGNLYTPFEFYHHDLIHANNSVFCTGGNIPEINKLYKHIKSNKIKLGKKYHDFIMMLFFLIHEACAVETTILTTKRPLTIIDVAKTSDSSFGKIENWMNPRYYGGLLPPEIQGKADKFIPYFNTTVTELADLYQQLISQKAGGHYSKYLNLRLKQKSFISK